MSGFLCFDGIGLGCPSASISPCIWVRYAAWCSGRISVSDEVWVVRCPWVNSPYYQVDHFLGGGPVPYQLLHEYPSKNISLSSFMNIKAKLRSICINICRTTPSKETVGQGGGGTKQALSTSKCIIYCFVNLRDKWEILSNTSFEFSTDNQNTELLSA